MLFLVVVIAGAHGLWLLPAILSLVGGAKHSTELGAPEDPAKKTSKNQITVNPHDSKRRGCVKRDGFFCWGLNMLKPYLSRSESKSLGC